MLGHQHHRNRHHDFVRNRIEESAETSALIPATRQVAIKPVGHRRDEENQGAGKRSPAKREIKRQYKEWNKNDAKQSKQRRDIKLHGNG